MAGGDDYITKPFEQAVVVARIRSLLRIKELHDAAQLQAAQLKEQTERLSSWNRSLEERVTKQVAAIERIDRLRRFLAPQVAQVIASPDACNTSLHTRHSGDSQSRHPRHRPRSGFSSSSQRHRATLRHRSTEIGKISRVCSVIVVNVHSEQLRHDCAARAHTLIELTPSPPMRSVSFGNQPVAHRAGSILAKQLTNWSER
jgi:hypothetical protein